MTAFEPPPRLILVDLDGTLLGADGHISERNAVVLRRATNAGSRLVVATGRPARLLGPIRERLSSPVVLCYNGAITLDLATGEVLDSRLLPGAALYAAVRRLRASGLRLLVAAEGMPDDGIRAEVDFRPGWPIPHASLEELCEGPIVKGLLRVELDDFAEVREALAAEPGLTATTSGIPGLIEISGAGISKGTVIAGLAERWGIHPSHAIAFGDMPNDIDMLRWAGWSVAMGNADEEVKLAASEVGAHHDDHAVARVLERWF